MFHLKTKKMKTSTAPTKTQRIVLGNLKQDGKFKSIEGAICLDNLDSEEVKKLTYKYEGRTYLNIKVIQRKEVSEYGKTHYIEVDQYVPANKR